MGALGNLLAYSAVAPAPVVGSTRGFLRWIAGRKALSVGGTRAGPAGLATGGGPVKGARSLNRAGGRFACSVALRPPDLESFEKKTGKNTKPRS